MRWRLPSTRSVSLAGLLGLVSCWSPASMVTSEVPAGCRGHDCCGLSASREPAGLEAEALRGLVRPGVYLGSKHVEADRGETILSAFVATVDVGTRRREVDRIVRGPTGVCTARICEEYANATFDFDPREQREAFPISASGLGSVRFYRTEVQRVTDTVEHIVEGVVEFSSDPVFTIVSYSNGNSGCWACVARVAQCLRDGGVGPG